VDQRDTVFEWPADAPAPAIAPFSAEQAKQYQETQARHLNRAVVETNSIGMKLALIPPGDFQMGSPPSEDGRKDNERQHRVRITNVFYMGVHEVTQKAYQDLMIKNPSYFSPGGAGKDQVRNLDTNQFPVESVSWIDAVEFCRRLSASPAEQSAGRAYRLPTEAEWEYACRAGTTTPFDFGSRCDGTEANCNGNGSYGIGTAGPRLGRPTTVGSYTPNPFGLCDMHGNVWELCSDWYGEYGKSVEGAVDPVGAKIGSYRVERGGGWLDSAVYCRSAFRLTDQPPNRFYSPSYLGFRVAAVPVSRASEAASDAGSEGREAK
jgi:formylglycine-generating enzyme required for sulfatase activity